MYKGYVVKVQKLRKHENADRLQIATFFGNDVVVGLNTKVEDIGVYFPCDLQLSAEFAQKNDLLKRKDENGNQAGGFLDPDKRNIKAIRLRGEKSDGLFVPITAFDYCYPDIKGGAAMMLNVGDTIDVVNGHEICTKYIPRTNHRTSSGLKGNKTRKYTAPISPLFMEHADTEQLAYNLDAFHNQDQIEITLKMHGTSQRTGYLPKLVKMHRTLLDRIFKRPGTPIYDWGYVTGTRRVVLNDFDGGFYGSNAFREQHAKVFEGKLQKGEIVYYEVVSYTDTGIPIMPSAKTPKEYIKKYGETMEFSYGRTEGSDIYVYRMVMVNEDGFVVEYSPEFMHYRCEQMGIKYVPVMWKGTIPEYPASKEDDTISAGEWIKNVAERYYDGPDPIGRTHIREGVVVRILNRPKFTAFKHKNFCFKICAGIAVETITNSNIEVSDDMLAEM